MMFVLYGIRFLMYPRKCATEWDCPLRGPLFGTITITIMTLCFLLDDVHNDETIADDSSDVTRGFFFGCGHRAYRVDNHEGRRVAWKTPRARACSRYLDRVACRARSRIFLSSSSIFTRH
mmetsp:Transcript_29931/g.43959  ORF Transcript_29931/g.43959 Transcript_29931/m.43959 type:complete len:120 (-) Transcript_29931:1322-1681(-)